MSQTVMEYVRSQKILAPLYNKTAEYPVFVSLPTIDLLIKAVEEIKSNQNQTRQPRLQKDAHNGKKCSNLTM